VITMDSPTMEQPSALPAHAARAQAREPLVQVHQLEPLPGRHTSPYQVPPGWRQTESAFDKAIVAYSQVQVPEDFFTNLPHAAQRQMQLLRVPALTCIFVCSVAAALLGYCFIKGLYLAARVDYVNIQCRLLHAVLLGYCMVTIVLPLSGHLCRLSMLVATVSSVLVIAVQVAQPASKVGCCQVWNFAEEELVCSCIALSCMSVTSFLSRCMRRRIQHIHGNCDLNSTSTNQSNTR